MSLCSATLRSADAASSTLWPRWSTRAWISCNRRIRLLENTIALEQSRIEVNVVGSVTGSGCPTVCARTVPIPGTCRSISASGEPWVIRPPWYIGILPVNCSTQCSMAAPTSLSWLAFSMAREVLPQVVTTRCGAATRSMALAASRLTTPGLAPMPTMAQTFAACARSSSASMARVGSGSSQISM
ncbi:hypothetical protein D3C81_1648120 [compost metagenome]